MKTRPDASTKPYYKCLFCSLFRKECGGIPTRDMDLKNWCEYMRDVKEHFHLKIADISEKADSSVKTVERIMAMNCEQDLMRDTARRMEIAVFGPAGRHLCAVDHVDNAAAEQVERLMAEIAYWKEENGRKAKIIDRLIND